MGRSCALPAEIKAHAVVEAVKDEFAGGLDKIVLMRWNTEVGRILREGLADYGVVSVNGSISLKEREEAERAFREDPKIRVFDGQIQAAGEAIDLSASAVLWFVQTCFTPALMGQAPTRTNERGADPRSSCRIAPELARRGEVPQDPK